jgi:hypothetical protein
MSSILRQENDVVTVEEILAKIMCMWNLLSFT